MNKSEFIAAVAEKSGLSKKDCESVHDAYIRLIVDMGKQDNKAQLGNWGSFQMRVCPARTGRNLRINEPVEIPAAKAPVFKPGKTLKEKLQ